MTETAFTYRVTKLSDDGYMAKCNVNPEVSIFAKSKDEISDRINRALQGYIDLFPYKVDKRLVEDRNIRLVEH